MILPVEIQNWYNENRERLLFVESVVKATLDNFTSPRGYLYGGRIKTIESLAEKIDTGRVESWSSIEDAYAGTVVIPTYRHEPDVREFLQTAFREVGVRERGSSKKVPTSFRFDATRVYCALSGQGYNPEISAVLFEVQILSAFDYAWQKVTHDLVFKHETVEWRRLRVAAQMKALVEQLDTISENFNEFVSGIRLSEWPDISAGLLVLEHLNDLFARGRLPTELKPAAGNRLAETVVGYLVSDGQRFSALDAAVRKAMRAVDDYLDHTAPVEIPRSLTLGQLLFGIMYRAGVISRNVRQRIFLNSALLAAFPELKEYANVFAL